MQVSVPIISRREIQTERGHNLKWFQLLWYSEWKKKEKKKTTHEYAISIQLNENTIELSWHHTQTLTIVTPLQSTLLQSTVKQHISISMIKK
jgi:hypothetical protein